MSSTKKRFSVGWVAGIGLGIACSTFAGSVSPSFAPKDTLTAAQMNGIATAITDNDSRITALESAATATQNCTGNNASDVMVRVGSLCVDKYPASLWSDTTGTATEITSMPGGCLVDGSGCAGANVIVAQSRQTPGSALNDGTTITWARAASACANAGKRLITGGEWLTANASGLILFAGTVPASSLAAGDSEWVDTQPLFASGTLTKPRGANIFNNNTGSGDAGIVLAGAGLAYDAFGASTTSFRCVR